MVHRNFDTSPNKKHNERIVCVRRWQKELRKDSDYNSWMHATISSIFIGIYGYVTQKLSTKQRTAAVEQKQQKSEENNGTMERKKPYLCTLCAWLICTLHRIDCCIYRCHTFKKKRLFDDGNGRYNDANRRKTNESDMSVQSILTLYVPVPLFQIYNYQSFWCWWLPRLQQIKN